MKLYKSLLTGRKTLVTLDNGGKYGKTFLEATIGYSGGLFSVMLNDGYTVLDVFKSFPGLKEAVAYAKKEIGPMKRKA